VILKQLACTQAFILEAKLGNVNMGKFGYIYLMFYYLVKRTKIIFCYTEYSVSNTSGKLKRLPERRAGPCVSVCTVLNLKSLSSKQASKQAKKKKVPLKNLWHWSVSIQILLERISILFFLQIVKALFQNAGFP